MPPRRKPLESLFVSGRPQTSNYRVLTPRTPHSKLGRAEEAFTEVELDELRNEENHEYTSYREEQNQPLLVSSDGSSFAPTGYRSYGDDERKGKVPSFLWTILDAFGDAFRKVPFVIGCILALILLGLIVLSYQKPGALERVIGTHVSTDEHQTMPSPKPSYVDTVPKPENLISYENYTKFPLTGSQYRDECNKLVHGFMHHKTYWSIPPNGIKDVVHHDDVTDYHLPEGERTRVCTKTITYQLDGSVGLLADLALMAQVAGLARERNRTLFVDDTYWNRGKWLDHFQDVRGRQPGPEPGCLSPPPQELVACPRLARHWVVNAKTAKFHFGHQYQEMYENPYGHEVDRKKPIFDRALQSLTETIRPNAHTAQLIRAARKEIATILNLPPHPSEPTNGDIHPQQAEVDLTKHHFDPYIAVHIRRGDRKAANYPYRNEHIPLDNYVKATHETWSRLFASPHSSSSSPASSDPLHFPSPPITYVASDSPTEIKQFISAFPSSTAVFSLESSTDPTLRGLASKKEYDQHEFDKEEEEERKRLTTGMIVDFAMMSGLWSWEGDVVPGTTVCTLSSNACKLAAVGLGFDRAFGFGDGTDHKMGEINNEKKRWVEIDNRGLVTPEWTAFEIFS
ncbi:hypothetical protein C8Q75DRAFT_784903 [Abortiporus biennis]|nr:hypothetical protein C8Q75DRAFT_784903 [Abortiporus biennis]